MDSDPFGSRGTVSDTDAPLAGALSDRNPDYADQLSHWLCDLLALPVPLSEKSNLDLRELPAVWIAGSTGG